MAEEEILIINGRRSVLSDAFMASRLEELADIFRNRNESSPPWDCGDLMIEVVTSIIQLERV